MGSWSWKPEAEVKPSTLIQPFRPNIDLQVHTLKSF